MELRVTSIQGKPCELWECDLTIEQNRGKLDLEQGGIGLTALKKS